MRWAMTDIGTLPSRDLKLSLSCLTISRAREALPCRFWTHIMIRGGIEVLMIPTLTQLVMPTIVDLFLRDDVV